MKFIELFAGIGGFRYGLEGVGILKGQKRETDLSYSKREHIRNTKGTLWKSNTVYNCVWANEIDKYACQVYRKNFGEGELYEGDITKIEAGLIPDHDLLCAGFPCQAFSIAGKRRGFTDIRGTLFFEIIRIAREKQPRLLLLENVKGLLSHEKGRTFKIILAALDEIGYDCQWEVLNSKNFGVPQNRERVFIVGHLRGTSRPQVFPIGEGTTIFNKPDETKQREKVVASTVRPGLSGLPGNSESYVISRPHGFNKGSIKKEPTIRACNNYAGNEPLITQGKIRRLTPTECERLQGFPDGWTEGISDTQRYKCLGNAVTTNVITEIGRCSDV